MAEEAVIGEERIFTIEGKKLTIPANLDVFNTYRIIYRDLANEMLNQTKIAYNRNVVDFDSFIEFFMQIYESKLERLVEKAVNTLIIEEVWTITQEAFMNQHVTDFHLAIDDYQVMLNNFQLTLEQNTNSRANAMSYVPNMVGFGYGIGGALSSMATAVAFNVVRDNIESSVIKNTNVTPEQRRELYSRLNTDILFEHAFLDYWRVFISLVYTLNQNGKNIWWPTEDLTVKANNIFSNISNPNFPQDKILDVMIDILQTNPYNDEYYHFLVSKYGETEELLAIKEYFKYE